MGYILVIIGAVISAIASAKVNSAFNKYNQVLSRKGITAEQVASMMLRRAGIHDVSIMRISGSLTDNYSPNEKVLHLSESVYGSSSVAAIGVAAHECGHAIQHEEEYKPLALRSIAVPMANIGSKLSWPIIIIGLVLGWTGLARLGILLFCTVVFFQLITLPVEFNASSRALAILEGDGILYDEELDGAKAVLKAAAMTYLAALFASILQLLRLVLMTRNNNRR